MRNYPKEESHTKEVEILNAEPWQVEILKLNPEYTSWGIYEDYMGSNAGSGWDSAQSFNSWKEFGPWHLDELNEVVNFYFEIDRKKHECTDCEGYGYNKDTNYLYKTWYGSLYDLPQWSDKLTQVEVDALWDAKRLYDFKEKPSPEEVNKKYKTGMGHDSLNCWICVEARAKSLGVYGKCPSCSGRGHIFDEPKAHVNLVLWFLHPRKGCSRGVEVRNISLEDLPEVIAYLKVAAIRNESRFSKLNELY